VLVQSIFSSIQGEGQYVGYRQIFLRLGGCNLSCDYCDEQAEGQMLSVPEVLAKIKALNTHYHHSLSITGGEPLLQVNELLTLIPDLPLPVYLETNATLPNHLREIKDKIDIFSLDYKPGYDVEFQSCLELVKDDDTQVKFILMHNQPITVIKQAAEIVKLVNKDIPFIIQPVTPHRTVKHMPTSDEILAAYTIVKNKLNDVRVIPQTHKMIHLQ
jgi:organic radical activating enzyme